MSNFETGLKVMNGNTVENSLENTVELGKTWMKDSVLTLNSLPVRILFLLLLSLLVLGFGISLTHASEELGAQYLVPASVISDTAHGYAISAAGIVSNPDGTSALRFRLPPELVGPNPAENVLREVRGGLPTFRQYANLTMSATCTDGPVNTSCVINYSRTYALSVDVPAVNTFLRQKFGGNPPLLATMIARSGGWKHDPEGIVILFH